VLSYELFLKRPGRLDGVEVRRVRGLKDDADPASRARWHDAGVVVSPQVVHDEDVTATELGKELFLEPANETVTVCRLPDGGEYDPASTTNRSKQREVGAAIHRNAVDEFLATAHPGVASAHRHGEPRFVEEDEPIDDYPADLLSELGASFDDIGPKTLQRPSALFFTTYPCRCSARFMLDT
jgi:hypothetical protein